MRGGSLQVRKMAREALFAHAGGEQSDAEQRAQARASPKGEMNSSISPGKSGPARTFTMSQRKKRELPSVLTKAGTNRAACCCLLCPALPCPALLLCSLVLVC